MLDRLGARCLAAGLMASSPGAGRVGSMDARSRRTEERRRLLSSAVPGKAGKAGESGEDGEGRSSLLRRAQLMVAAAAREVEREWAGEGVGQPEWGGLVVGMDDGYERVVAGVECDECFSSGNTG